MKHAKTIIIYTIGGMVALGAIGYATYLATPTVQTHYVATPVTRGDITETVTGTGTVAPDQLATLAFDQQAGTIATVNVTVGDHVKAGAILGSLESDILQASLAQAQAGLASLASGAKPADIALYQQKTEDANTALASAMRDSYLKTEDALQNQVDVLFTNPETVNPVINIRTENQQTAITINNEYLVATEKVATWKADLDAENGQARADGNDALVTAKSFLSDLATIATDLNLGNSGLTQSVIDADRAVINGAASEVTGATSEYTAAVSAYNDATAALTLEQSSSTPDEIAAQQAVIDGIQAQINHTEITAPFDGIITDVEPKVGEVFAAGTPVFSIMSSGAYKVEVYVSETDVAKIAVGDSAQITLDAYGSGTLFPATITAIDPAETVVNGVNSYKVTLHFTQIDPRVKSGMTANVSITAGGATNVIVVPTSALITEGTATYVLAENADGTFARKQVQIGITGATSTEITSGLSSGDMIAAFGTADGE